MDFLHEHKEKIEESLYWRLADLLSLDVDLVFYDTTSVHFEIAPQMIVGMAVTRDGFPVKSWVFPGNTTDVTTIEIRPVFHRSPHRIRAHVFLCVLSLLLERVAEKACGTTWFRIREELRSIKIGQLFGPKGTVYQVISGTPEARNMLKKLNIDPLPSVLSVE